MDFSPTSNIDILITFAPEAKRGAFALAQIQGELAAMFGQAVDLVSRQAIERSQNWIRRKNILESAQIIYAA